MKVNYSSKNAEIKLSHKEYAALAIMLSEGIRKGDYNADHEEIARRMEQQFRNPDYIL